MFIVLLNYKKPLDIVDQHIVAHRAYLEEGYKKNYFIASGPRNPRTGGIILSQLKNYEQLTQILNMDPFVINDIVDYEIIDFNPVKYHQHFATFVE